MRRALTLAPVALTLACGTGASQPGFPVLADLSPAADAELALVDRTAALQDAVDADEAEAGPAIDLAGVPDAFRMEVDSSAAEQLPDGRSWGNAHQAVGMVAVANLATAFVVGPPSAAIHIAAGGTVTEVAPNVWTATNSVSDGTRTVAGTFTVAWVGVGWLAEMRLTSDDGVYADTLWFKGFLSEEGRLGWWDLYDGTGTLVGVVEWIADGQGNGQFGIAALSGDIAGDTLSYLASPGAWSVTYHDADRAEDAWVAVFADGSGELRSPDYNGGTLACWAAAEAEEPYADAACP